MGKSHIFKSLGNFTIEKGYVYYAGGKNLDARKLGELMRDKLSAKGGGSSEMIQGRTTETCARIMEFWKNECQNR